MRVDKEDRFTPVQAQRRMPLLLISFLISLVFILAAVAVSPEFRNYGTDMAYRAGAWVGATRPDAPFQAVYKRLDIEPLPQELLAEHKIYDNLSILTHEPCDKQAVYALGEALVEDRRPRLAANIYVGFSKDCPNGEGDLYRAGQLLLQLGDGAKALEIATPLIAKNPGVAEYRYLHGQAFAYLKRYDEALADYKSAILLTKNPRDVGEWVFLEMATIYAAMGRSCDAVSTIVKWVSLDPATRNTVKAHQLIKDYMAQGCHLERPEPTLPPL